MRNKYILAVAISVGGGLSIFASGFPDGLEKVAENKNFIDLAISYWPGFIPDYLMPGVTYERLATSIAGIIGVFSVFLILSLINFLLCHKIEKA